MLTNIQTITQTNTLLPTACKQTKQTVIAEVKTKLRPTPRLLKITLFIQSGMEVRPVKNALR